MSAPPTHETVTVTLCHACLIPYGEPDYTVACCRRMVADGRLDMLTRCLAHRLQNALEQLAAAEAEVLAVRARLDGFEAAL